MCRVERHDDKPPVDREDTAKLAKGNRSVDEMAGEPHDRALEPAVSEGQVLRATGLQPNGGRHVAGGHAQHFRLGIDAPDLRGLRIRERLAKAPRAAAAVEHAPAAEVALTHDDLEDLAPVVVDRPEVIVVGGQATEIGRARYVRRQR